jgi:sterol desaturase/sphingolipid hydroxylase (fatty acid hydroxylase superfamily)
VFEALFLSPVKALLLAAVVFIPFERLAGERTAQRTLRRGWAMDALTALANGVLLYGVLLMVLGAIDAVAAAGAPQLRSWIVTRPLWAQAILAVALGDLGVYAIHRLAHTVPWLWRFHAVHHSAEEMDWLVAVRHHPFDLLLFRIASIGPLVALNISPAAIAVFVAVFGWQSWLAHANVRLPYGPLRWVLVSPEFHHWHHSAEREAYNRNYANVFACWDVIFGTVHLPPGRQPLRYGVDEPVPAGFIGRFLYPFGITVFGRTSPQPDLPSAPPAQSASAP